ETDHTQLHASVFFHSTNIGCTFAEVEFWKQPRWHGTRPVQEPNGNPRVFGVRSLCGAFQDHATSESGAERRTPRRWRALLGRVHGLNAGFDILRAPHHRREERL